MASLKQRLFGSPVVAPFVRPLLAHRFRTRPVAQAQHGIYPDFQSALAAIPASAKSISYDSEEAGSMYAGRPVFPEDYAVLHWLQQHTKAGSRVFDFGGHSGRMYDALADIWPGIRDLDWTVHDVAAAVAQGQALNAERSPPIGFTADPRDGDGHDLWLVSGSTQYIERPLRAFLEDLQTLPRVVLVNQTPLHPRLSFVTLQRLTNTFCPYVIRNQGSFLGDLEALGYRIQATWRNPGKSCVIPSFPAHSDLEYLGCCAVLPSGAG